MPIARPMRAPATNGRRYAATAQSTSAPGSTWSTRPVIDRRVGQEQVEHRRRDAQPDVLEVPPADHHHPGHDRQLRDDRHHPGGGLVDHPAVRVARLRLLVGCRRGRRRSAAWRSGAAGRAGVARPEPGQLVGVDLVASRASSRSAAAAPARSSRCGRRGDHVGQQEHQQRDPQEEEAARGQVRLQHRPADHHRVAEHAHQEPARHDERSRRTRSAGRRRSPGSRRTRPPACPGPGG